MSDHPEPGCEEAPLELARAADKLRKINAALMNRVERSMDHQANAFSLFQTAISQETQIRQRTEELNHALSKLARANLELSSARDAAEHANAFKTRFFTAVGHDLLQPLHAARLTLAELAEVQETTDNRRLVGNISTALSTIEELLTSILDISKLEAGVFVPNIQTVALGPIFEQFAVSFDPMTRKKQLEFRWRPTDLSVRSDPLMLRRMLQNLVGNAVHYTATGGLLLAARRRGDQVEIEVWDTGPGIAGQEQRQIFEEFQRGAASVRSGGAGFGLGLAIVRRMANALGHELKLQSRLDRGSRFTIVAPFAAAANKANPAVQTPTADTGTLAAQPVLVIDNDLAILEAMQALLTRWGADVRLARDLDDVSDILSDEGFKPAIILADYHLDGGLVGLDVVARVRNVCGEEIPAILITADRTNMTADAARAGRCELLHKPVRPAELRALMQHLVS